MNTVKFHLLVMGNFNKEKTGVAIFSKYGEC